MGFCRLLLVVTAAVVWVLAVKLLGKHCRRLLNLVATICVHSVFLISCPLETVRSRFFYERSSKSVHFNRVITKFFTPTPAKNGKRRTALEVEMEKIPIATYEIRDSAL